MRARSRAEVLIDLMKDADEAALVTRAAVKLGLRLTIDDELSIPGDEVLPGAAHLDHREFAFLEADLWRMVALLALVEDVSPTEILDRLRSDIARDLGDVDKSPRETLS